MQLWAWFSAFLAVAIVAILSWWLRRLATRGEEYHDRDYKAPTILDVWNRGGP